MSEKIYTSDQHNINNSFALSAETRLREWASNIRQSEVDTYNRVALGDAGISRFDDSARRQLEEQAEYDKYMEKFAPSVNEKRRENIANGRVKYDSLDEIIASVDSGNYNDSVDNRIKSDKTLRFMNLLATQINSLYSNTLSTKYADKDAERLEDLEDSLIDRLVRYENSGDFSPEVANRILSIAFHNNSAGSMNNKNGLINSAAEPELDVNHTNNSSDLIFTTSLKDGPHEQDQVGSQLGSDESVSTQDDNKEDLEENKYDNSTDVKSENMDFVGRALQTKDRLIKHIAMYDKRIQKKQKRITVLEARLATAQSRNPRSNRSKQLERKLKWQKMLLREIQTYSDNIDMRMAGRNDTRYRNLVAQDAQNLLDARLKQIKKEMKEERKRPGNKPEGLKKLFKDKVDTALDAHRAYIASRGQKNNFVDPDSRQTQYIATPIAEIASSPELNDEQLQQLSLADERFQRAVLELKEAGEHRAEIYREISGISEENSAESDQIEKEEANNHLGKIRRTLAATSSLASAISMAVKDTRKQYTYSGRHRVK